MSDTTNSADNHKQRPEGNTLYCSFCGKSQYEVRKLVAGPTVFICDECIDLCADILRAENKKMVLPGGDLSMEVALLGLDRLVPGNREVKKHVATEVVLVNAITRQTRAPARALYLGPEGAGISEMLRGAWQGAGAVVVVEDAVRLRPTSLFQGAELLLQMLQASDYNVERAQRGVIIIENIDRIARSGEEFRRLQEELETLIRGVIVGVPPPGEQRRQREERLQIDTSGISFFATSSVLHRGQAAVVEDHASNESEHLALDHLRERLALSGFLHELVHAFDEVRLFSPIRRSEFNAYLSDSRSRIWQEWNDLMKTEQISLDADCRSIVLDGVVARGGGMRSLHGVLRALAMRVVLHGSTTPDAPFVITPQWLREAL